MIDYNIFNPGDKVLFMPPAYTIYDLEGRDVYKNLETNKEYIVDEAYILCLKLKDIEGIYLKERFHKKWEVKKD